MTWVNLNEVFIPKTGGTVSGDLNIDGNISAKKVTVTHSTAVDSFFIASRTDIEKEVRFGIGGSSHKRGIYDKSAGAWTICRDDNNDIYIGSRQYGVNKVLWSGAWYMNASQTATLSEAVSAQPNGIVLVFSRYQDGVAQNWGFESFFVPKYVVATHAAQGSYFSSNQQGRPWSKYIYISDTELKGNNDNTNDGEFDGRYLFNDFCVLRYVIGV